jgi:hypothetical protein
MLSVFATIIRKYPAFFGIICLGIGLLTGLLALNDRRGWLTAEARVLEVADLCQMEAVIPIRRGATETLRGQVACADVEAEKLLRPDIEFTVTQQLTIKLAFSGANGQQHEASARALHLGLSELATVGSSVPVEFRASDPTAVRKVAIDGNLIAALVLAGVGLVLIGLAVFKPSALSQATNAEAGAPSWADQIDLATATPAQRAVLKSAAAKKNVAAPVPQRRSGVKPTPTPINAPAARSSGVRPTVKGSSFGKR